MLGWSEWLNDAGTKVLDRILSVNVVYGEEAISSDSASRLHPVEQCSKSVTAGIFLSFYLIQNPTRI